MSAEKVLLVVTAHTIINSGGIKHNQPINKSPFILVIRIIISIENIMQNSCQLLDNSYYLYFSFQFVEFSMFQPLLHNLSAIKFHLYLIRNSVSVALLPTFVSILQHSCLFSKICQKHYIINDFFNCIVLACVFVLFIFTVFVASEQQTLSLRIISRLFIY